MSDLTANDLTKHSLRVYKAVRKGVRNWKVPEGHIIIPGRTRGLNAAYVEVRKTDDTGPVAGIRHYFEHIPSKKEVKIIINSMIEELDE